MNSNSNGRPRAEKLRQGALIGLTALAAFDLGFWLIAVRPLNNREAARRAEIAQLQSSIAAQQENTAKLEGANVKVVSASQTGDALLARLTFDRRTTYSILLTELDRAARAAGVEVRETNYNSDEIEGNEQFGRVSIDANLRGKYENLVKFLNELDRSEAFLIVGSLGALPREEGDLQITMRLDAFVREAGMIPDIAAVQEDAP